MSRVRGTLRLRQVARLLREATPELRKEMSKGIRRPLRPFRKQLKANVVGSVPAQYAGVLAPALRASLMSNDMSSGGGLGYTVVVYARGKAEDRDVRAVNAGVLRHKTWGREPWHAQRVRGGFVDRAVDDLGRQVAKEVDKAVEAMARKIEGG